MMDLEVLVMDKRNQIAPMHMVKFNVKNHKITVEIVVLVNPHIIALVECAVQKDIMVMKETANRTAPGIVQAESADPILYAE
jgi:ectoine hydroxylase-related dioxygenase (phytanoyl-CoA dioxygenase family)